MAVMAWPATCVRVPAVAVPQGEAQAPARVKRSFDIDLRCPQHNATMKLKSFLTNPKSLQRLLTQLGEPTAVQASRDDEIGGSGALTFVDGVQSAWLLPER
jgi:hypothetical protein